MVLDNSLESVSSRPVDNAHQVSDSEQHTYLRMRPNHFFSNIFQIDAVKTNTDSNEESPSYQGAINKFVDLNLLLMIIFIGFPILIYCIAASAK